MWCYRVHASGHPPYCGLRVHALSHSSSPHAGARASQGS